MDAEEEYFVEKAILIEQSVEWWEKEFNKTFKEYEEAELQGDEIQMDNLQQELVKIYRRCAFENEQLNKLEKEYSIHFLNKAWEEKVLQPEFTGSKDGEN